MCLTIATLVIFTKNALKNFHIFGADSLNSFLFILKIIC